MPILEFNQYSAPVIYPKENYKVYKYFDIIKFISLLQRKSLFFCRLDKFEDKFEGSSPKLNIEYRKKYYEQIHNELLSINSKIEVSLEKDLKVRQGFEEEFKKLNCVCCWNKSKSESYALWKIYSEMNKGIMVTSQIDKLINSLKNNLTDDIQISEIKYIDFETEMIPDGNLNYQIIHKHKAYSYEDELRLIYKIPEVKRIDFDWEKEDNNSGINIKLDLNILIDDIVLSPYSPEWFTELVQDLMLKYGLNKQIRKSIIK